jgi:hypothetical protein
VAATIDSVQRDRRVAMAAGVADPINQGGRLATLSCGRQSSSSPQRLKAWGTVYCQSDGPPPV